MRPSRIVTTLCLVLLTAALVLGAPAGRALADTAGTVHFVRQADSSFDVFTRSPSPETQAWMRSHIWRMTVWSPYFDEKTGWYPNGWFYQDAYAIYKGSALASEHPEWILRDSAGNELYIPWGCSEGSCPQYAGDISNPAYRHYWIAEAEERLAHGYRGVFIDDVNMEEQTGNGEGQHVVPIDPGTGAPISEQAWRAYMAEFMSEIRAALPHAEIVHNVIWFADSDAGSSEPSIRREIESADYICLERGVNDAGLTGGSGRWSLNAFFHFADEVHALGRGVVLAGSASDVPGMEYNLASYFLLSSGNDAVGGSGQTPENWWGGWNVNLGEAIGGRWTWENLLRRDFTGGMVLVNPPEAPAVTVSLPAPMRQIDGNLITSVTLAPASGVVLTGAVPAGAAPAGQALASVPTHTTVETAAAGTHGSPGAAASRRRRDAGRSAAHRHPHKAGHAHSARARLVLARISGSVSRAPRGIVAIEVQRRQAAGWLTVRRLRAALTPSGRFTQLLYMRSGVRYRVRAAYTGASGFLPSSSNYRLVTLRAR